MTVPAQRPATTHPNPLDSRHVAVRQVLVNHLVGIGPNAEFMRVIPALLAALTPHLREPVVLINGKPFAAQLSDREIEVLQLAANGKSNRELGAELGITEDTVKTHLRRVYRRLNVRDRTEAVAVAMRHGVVR